MKRRIAEKIVHSAYEECQQVMYKGKNIPSMKEMNGSDWVELYGRTIYRATKDLKTINYFDCSSNEKILIDKLLDSLSNNQGMGITSTDLKRMIIFIKTVLETIKNEDMKVSFKFQFFGGLNSFRAYYLFNYLINNYQLFPPIEEIQDRVIQEFRIDQGEKKISDMKQELQISKTEVIKLEKELSESRAQYKDPIKIMKSQLDSVDPNGEETRGELYSN